MNTFLPARLNCDIKESSSMDVAPKFEEMSTNVGKEPVVIALIRCIVAVGGSVNELNRNEFDG